MWKYGASIGVSGTPTHFINGVKLDGFPQSVDEWTEIFDSLLPAQTKKVELIEKSNDELILLN